MKKEVFRIIDANLNRSREGLRVCEEVVRFILNSKTLTEELKSVRHGITAIAGTLYKDQKACEPRDVKGDVGKNSRIRQEYARRSPFDIFSANIERVKESLRVLEEFSKLINIKRSAQFKRLRFRVYDIEKRVDRKILAVS